MNSIRVWFRKLLPSAIWKERVWGLVIAIVIACVSFFAGQYSAERQEERIVSEIKEVVLDSIYVQSLFRDSEEYISIATYIVRSESYKHATDAFNHWLTNNTNVPLEVCEDMKRLVGYKYWWIAGPIRSWLYAPLTECTTSGQ